MSKHKFEIGQKFGKLTVIEYSHTGKHWRKYYKCKCDCGNDYIGFRDALISGNTKSCGCLYKDLGENKRLPNNGGHINQLILLYKRHATDRGFDFSLTLEQAEKKFNSPCYYCGLTGVNTHKSKRGHTFNYNGIDRMDPQQGYTDANTVSCCKVCNIAKGTMTSDEFVDWIKLVYNHMAEQWS